MVWFRVAEINLVSIFQVLDQLKQLEVTGICEVVKEQEYVICGCTIGLIWVVFGDYSECPPVDLIVMTSLYAILYEHFLVVIHLSYTDG